MKRLLLLVAFFATLQASAQQVNPVPDYVFRNQMSVGRGTVTDTAAYFSIGPRYGANKGFMPPIVGDTATFSSGKRNGLLIFSVQKNKFLYWDSVRVQWSDMAGSSGTYITGTGITGYVPQFSGTTTIDTSALFTLGSRLGIGTSSFAYTLATSSSIELNGTSGSILGFKRNDSARGYLWHTGDNMELANTVAGAISFNTNSATRGSISSAGVWRLNNLAGTGDRVVVASSNGTLSASTSVTGLVDTTTLSTRAWRQKGDDSLGAIIATKGSGTVTSVATGYGLSGGTITTTGTLLVDTLNIATRAWRQKGLDSLAALEVSGSGTTNYVPKFTAASTIGNSQIFDNGTNVGVGTTFPTVKLDIVGSAGTVVRTKGGTGSAQGSAYYVQLAGSTNTLSAFGDRASILGGTVDQIASIYTGSGIPLTFDVGNTERLRITSGGNVGIGISTPANNGAGETGVEIRGANYPMLTISTPTISQFSGVGLTSGYIGTSTNHPFTILSNSAERLRIFANGRVGVNTTTDAGYQFDVNGSIRASGLIRSEATVGNTNGYFQLDHPGAQTWKLGVFTDNTSTFSIGNDNGGTFASRYLNVTNGGNVGIGTASPTNAKLVVEGSSAGTIGAIMSTDAAGTTSFVRMVGDVGSQNLINWQTGTALRFATSTQAYGTFAEHARINSNGELLINTTTDAGDYKLQVSGNALVTAGKLDISSNTTFSMNVQRSGTSAVAGTFNNSNGILYLGAESSAGGAIFTGSSAYAAVIGSGAAYPLQFATNNVTRATLNTDGELLLNTLSDQGDYKLQVNGSVYNTGQVTRGTINTIGTGAQLSTDSTTNIPAISINQSLTGASAQSLISATTTWNTTGNPTLLDFNVTNTASGATANYLQISDGTNIFRVTKDAGLFTSAPAGGTARKWKFGSAATVSPTSPNRTIQIEVDGVIYYLHAKTTND